MESKELALEIASAALDKHATSVDIIYVGDKADYADYLVICSGRSERQVDAITQGIEGALKKKRIFPLGIEGKNNKQWILMDFNDVVVHVFEDMARGFYDLDGLWMDAARVPVPSASNASDD